MVGVLMLPETIHRRLASVPNLSRQGKRINGLFRLLDGPELWQKAYEEIAQNQGALTPGSTSNTLDGFSLERVENIIRAIKEGRYQFAPVRRIHIPKPNGKTRPLGIPTADDKLVQAAVKLLLELVYEPVFSDHSHGFRRQRSCHTALDQIRRLWNGTKWIIEVDVVSFFDNINHSVLLRLLSKRIDDKRLLVLIENMLKAGVMEDWEFKASFSGTPQGGVASPILANIYLHELDQFMAEMKADFDQGKERRRTPEYRHLKGVIGRKRAVLATLKAEGADVTSTEVARLLAELEDLEKRLLLTPSADPMDPGYRRLSYCRYADDVRHFTGRWIPFTERRGLEETTLGPTAYPAVKAKGDRSMPSKRERPEDADGRVPQGPRDKVRTALFEPQSPGMQAYIPRHSV